MYVQGKEKEVDSARRELSGGHKSDHIVLINAMKVIANVHFKDKKKIYVKSFLLNAWVH